MSNEAVGDFKYYWLFETESGIGYNKSFDNGKNINFAVNIPNKFWKFWEYSVGIDVNYGDKGFGLSVGLENTVSIHSGNTSHDFYLNALGRLGHKVSTKDNMGIYNYHKVELNGPEILATSVAIAYISPYVMALMKWITSIPGIIWI